MRWITRTKVGLSSAAVLAGALTLLAPALPATADTAPTGSVTIQLTTLSGEPLRLSGALVQLDEAVFEPVAQATTDSAGTVHFDGVLSGSGYDAVVLSTPDDGPASYAPGETDHVTVATGTTTSVAVALPVGATVSGRLVDASGAPSAHTTVDVQGDGNRPWDAQVVTDAGGRYEVHGLQSEIVELYAYGSPQGFPAEWKTRVTAGSLTRQPSKVTLSTRMVHTDYDLRVEVEAKRPLAALERATVRAIDTTTGAVVDETTSAVLDSWQTAEWDLPSGSYRLEVITAPTPASASKTYWFTAGFQLSSHADEAAVVPVSYGGQRSYDETLP